MAFIDELKKGAIDFAGKAKQKTTKITGITKISLAIKSNENKLATVYEEIGRLFYLAEREGADNTEAIATAIMKADKYNADIELAKRELAELRAVKTCDECGNEIVAVRKVSKKSLEIDAKIEISFLQCFVIGIFMFLSKPGGN